MTKKLKGRRDVVDALNVPPRPKPPPYYVLPEAAIPLQAASKLVGWVAAGAVERLELLINKRADEIVAALPKRRKP